MIIHFTEKCTNAFKLYYLSVGAYLIIIIIIIYETKWNL